MLRPWDLGSWTGRPLADLDLAAWRGDPGYDAHGGESLLALIARVGTLLEQWHGLHVRLVAVTHAAVIKAAVVHALGAPAAATWDLDVHPGSTTELHPTRSGWRVRHVNAQVGHAR
jgi:broad specificity phosphatase PhoE